MKTAALLAVTLTLTATFAGTGRADKLPLGVDAGASGVTAPGDSGGRYVTMPAGQGTVVARVQNAGGQIMASRFLHGVFTIPAVAYDGSASGLSADGRTLVLTRPRVPFPRATTAFAVVETRRLKLREVITLQGDFGFDAISPDGRSFYLIEYLSRRDPNRYAVRLYDLAAGRLLPDPIVDPTKPGEPMRGSPLTRVTSADGRWAYTLYDGAGKTPFVHALDTTGRTARCIDLDALAIADFSNLAMKLGRNDRTLSVSDSGSPLVLVDTRTFEPSEPPAPAPAASPAAERGEKGGGIPDVLVPALAGAALVAAAASALLRRRRRGLAPG